MSATSGRLGPTMATHERFQHPRVAPRAMDAGSTHEWHPRMLGAPMGATHGCLEHP